jgi:hypothetical protein
MTTEKVKYFPPHLPQIEGRTTWVYFAQEEFSLYIKIGWTTRQTVEERLDQVMPFCPGKLRFLAAIPRGEHRHEKALHHQFSSAHVHDEWFLPVPELVSFIRRVNPSAVIRSSPREPGEEG